MKRKQPWEQGYIPDADRARRQKFGKAWAPPPPPNGWVRDSRSDCVMYTYGVPYHGRCAWLIGGWGRKWRLYDMTDKRAGESGDEQLTGDFDTLVTFWAIEVENNPGKSFVAMPKTGRVSFGVNSVLQPQLTQAMARQMLSAYQKAFGGMITGMFHDELVVEVPASHAADALAYGVAVHEQLTALDFAELEAKTIAAMEGKTP